MVHAQYLSPWSRSISIHIDRQSTEAHCRKLNLDRKQDRGSRSTLIVYVAFQWWLMSWCLKHLSRLKTKFIGKLQYHSTFNSNKKQTEKWHPKPQQPTETELGIPQRISSCEKGGWNYGGLWFEFITLRLILFRWDPEYGWESIFPITKTILWTVPKLHWIFVQSKTE